MADVYVKHIENLKAAYATNSGKYKTVPKFHSASGAILTVNSNYWLNPNKAKRGWFVRNGVELARYDEKRLLNDFCVLYYDGRMETFESKSFVNDYEAGGLSLATLADRRPYQVFYFGPALLDEDGNAKTEFNSSLAKHNPRTVIGFYEPGHYAFICVLGSREIKNVKSQTVTLKQKPSLGMTLSELSQLCESLGLQAAYNLDGGGSSSMMFLDKLYGHNTRAVPDCLSVVEITQSP